jgi:hypothetical protein
MMKRSSLRRLTLSLLTGVALTVAGVSVSLIVAGPTPAMAQSSDDMTAALDAYGHWVRHAPYGEVWVPDGMPPDWRPYQYGHWVYTDDWGWYWVSDEQEDDWGWVVYHYGRWAFNRGIGWFWVPGDEWAPAWVDWRYGDDYVGWAPLPPDDMIDTYDAEPQYWAFVPLRYIGEPDLRRHYMPLNRGTVLLRDTRIINRPVHVEGRRFWVNPGLAPGFIAGRTHVPLHAYQVRPRVFTATTGVQGAVSVPKQDLRIKGAARRVAPVTVQRAATTIKPTTGAPPPKPLGKGEHGQLGAQPPRAAQGGPPAAAPKAPGPTPPAGSPPAGAPPRPAAPVQHPPGGAAPPPAHPNPPPMQSTPQRPEPPQAPPPHVAPRAPERPHPVAPRAPEPPHPVAPAPHPPAPPAARPAAPPPAARPPAPPAARPAPPPHPAPPPAKPGEKKEEEKK